MSTFQKSPSTASPEPSAATAAQSLRERIGQENVIQSSVLASRRLDDSLLRLERASASNRVAVGRHTSAPGPENAAPSSASKRPSGQVRVEPVQMNASSTTGELSCDAIEALFGQPTDVTVESTKAQSKVDRVLQPRDVVDPECAGSISEAAPPQAPVPVSAPSAGESQREFVSAWQVDEFLVPRAIDQLFLTDSLAEQLAARLVEARGDGLQTIGITSVAASEGRSSVAMGLALSIAFTGLRVALVDGDRNGVKIASELQLDLDLSWPESLRRDIPLEEVSVASQADALTLVPLLDREGGAEYEPPELNKMLGRLRQSFDMIVVDCGASAIEDVLLCGTALIVRDAKRTTVNDVENLSRALRSGGVHGIGVIENFCD